MKRDFTVGNFIHVYNRGNKKMSIVRDEKDKWRFLKVLNFFNDDYSFPNFFRDLQIEQRTLNSNSKFERPKTWPSREPLVNILSYCLKENHFHLLLEEIIVGGISKFMKKFSNGFTNFSNIKYEEVGSVFQGAYKANVLTGDIRNLQYLDCYVQVFNPFEDYPGGIEKALDEFNKAFQFALDNPFCSLGESFGIRKLNIVKRDGLKEMIPSNLKEYKKLTYDALVVRNIREILNESIKLLD